MLFSTWTNYNSNSVKASEENNFCNVFQRIVWFFALLYVSCVFGKPLHLPLYANIHTLFRLLQFETVRVVRHSEFLDKNWQNIFNSCYLADCDFCTGWFDRNFILIDIHLEKKKDKSCSVSCLFSLKS